MNIFCWNTAVLVVLFYLQKANGAMTDCATTPEGEQSLNVTVLNKIQYGETLKLVCNIEYCCPCPVAWTVDNKRIFIDVRELNPLMPVANFSRFKANWGANGATLFIHNFTEYDLNKTHECSFKGRHANMTLLRDNVVLGARETTTKGAKPPEVNASRINDQRTWIIAASIAGFILLVDVAAADDFALGIKMRRKKIR